MLTPIPPMGTTTPATRSNHLSAYLRQSYGADIQAEVAGSHASTSWTMTQGMRPAVM